MNLGYFSLIKQLSIMTLFFRIIPAAIIIAIVYFIVKRIILSAKPRAKSAGEEI